MECSAKTVENEEPISFVRFKSELYKYYKSALNVYDAENPRTWKSICLSCNKSRNLSCSNSCCY